MAKTSKGTCLFCNEVFGKRAIKTHLDKCKIKHEIDNKNIEKNNTNKIFYILVEDKYSKAFWFYLDADEKATLKKIDQLLRDIWLECCGHLSQFRIGNREKPMSLKLSSFMEEGLELNYEYDFGSTTYLTLKVLSKRDGSLGKELLRIDAINKMPEIKCSFCDNDAEFLCPFCFEEDMCNKCLKKHSCAQEEGEETMLPIVNSPRAGVCGYDGTTESALKQYYPKLK